MAAPIVLVPGFWLGAWAWDEVADVLRVDGHDVTAVTLPGLESPDADRSGITMEDHVVGADPLEEHLPHALDLLTLLGPVVGALVDAGPVGVGRRLLAGHDVGRGTAVVVNDLARPRLEPDRVGGHADDLVEVDVGLVIAPGDVEEVSDLHAIRADRGLRGLLRGLGCHLFGLRSVTPQDYQLVAPCQPGLRPPAAALMVDR